MSGGPDSLALLLLAAYCFEGRVEAITIDHRLRSEAAAEAELTSKICDDLNVPHTTVELLRKPRGNLSSKYRELRYAQMHEWAKRRTLDWLMTGHHADDQLETVIMRLNRGSGVGGLSAIRRRNGITVRPLLGWRRAELAAIVQQAGLQPAHDPSNHDERFDRARLRKALKGSDWLDPLAIAQSANAMEDADVALAWAAHRIGNERVDKAGDALVLNLGDVPAEIERRIVAACIRLLNAKAKLDGPKVTRLIGTLRASGKATLDGVVCDARGEAWVMRLAPPRMPVRSA